mgnify:CR=1 FL=1|tara:strand:- start:3926 stop:5323 length:1398 start_codon:yes stop_codon:yes gene_type:complete
MHDESSLLENDPKGAESQELYGASADLQEKVLKALSENQTNVLFTLLEEEHAADIADLIRVLKSEDRHLFLETVRHQLPAEVISELDESVRDEVFEILGTSGLAVAVKDLNTDDALDLIEDLDSEQQKEILRAVPAGERAILEEGLGYPEDSAGRLMQQEVVCVPPFWTVGEAISFIRDTGDVSDSLYTIYVVDPRHHPVGEISLSTLFKHPLDTQLSDIMSTDIRLIPVMEDQEKVGHLFRHYALVSAPVIDASGRIVGMITFDDVMSVIEEEAEEDLMLMAKVSESDFYEPVLTTAHWRARWLIVILMTTLLASLVISYFEASIQQITALAFLLPVASAIGGSSGMQVVTVVVRALATNSLREKDTWRAVGKEVLVSLIIGSFFALFAGSLVSWWLHDTGLGLILALGLFFNIIWAAFAGTLIPILIHRLNLDPAISAGPILATTTDIFGFAIFLGLATLFLL